MSEYESDYANEENPGQDPSEEAYQSENEIDDSPSEDPVTSETDLHSRVDQLVNNKIGNLQQQQEQIYQNQQNEIETLKSELNAARNTESDRENVYDNFTSDQNATADSLVRDHPAVKALEEKIATFEKGQEQSYQGAVAQAHNSLEQVISQAEKQHGATRIEPIANELREIANLVGYDFSHPHWQRRFSELDKSLKTNQNNNQRARGAVGSETSSERPGNTMDMPFIKDHKGNRVYSGEKQMEIALKQAAARNRR